MFSLRTNIRSMSHLVLDSRELSRGRGSSLIKLRAKIEQISARTDVRLRDRSLVRDAVVVLSGTTRVNRVR
jgi:hypothetical protein